MKESLVYIVCHLLFIIYYIILVLSFCWLALELKTAWVFLAFPFCTISYKHDPKFSSEED